MSLREGEQLAQEAKLRFKTRSDLTLKPAVSSCSLCCSPKGNTENRSGGGQMQSLCPWGHGWSHSTQAWRVSDGELRQGTGWSLPFQLCHLCRSGLGTDCPVSPSA